MNQQDLLGLARRHERSDRAVRVKAYLRHLGPALTSLVVSRNTLAEVYRRPGSDAGDAENRIAEWLRKTGPFLESGPGSARILCAWPPELRVHELDLLGAYALPVRWRPGSGTDLLPPALEALASRVRVVVGRELELPVEGVVLDVEDGVRRTPAFEDLVPGEQMLRSAFAPLALSLLAFLKGSRKGNPAVFATGVWSESELAFSPVGREGLPAKVRSTIELGGRKLYVPAENLTEATAAVPAGGKLRIVALVGRDSNHPGLARALLGAAIDFEIPPTPAESFEDRRSYYLRWPNIGLDREFYRHALLPELARRLATNWVTEHGGSDRSPPGGLVLTLGENAQSAGLAALLIGALRPRRFRILVSEEAKKMLPVLDGHLASLGIQGFRLGHLVADNPIEAGAEDSPFEAVATRRGIDLGNREAVLSAYRRAVAELAADGPVLVDATGGNKLCTIAALEAAGPADRTIYLHHQLGSDDAMPSSSAGESASGSPGSDTPSSSASAAARAVRAASPRLVIPGTERLLVVGRPGPSDAPSQAPAAVPGAAADHGSESGVSLTPGPGRTLDLASIPGSPPRIDSIEARAASAPPRAPMPGPGTNAPRVSTAPPSSASRPPAAASSPSSTPLPSCPGALPPAPGSPPAPGASPPASSVLYLLNSPVLTAYGTFRFEGPLDLDAARAQLQAGFVSAIGHATTAGLLSLLLGRPIPTDRKSITLAPGDRALVFRILDRLPEGHLPSAAELSSLRYELALMTRLA